MKTLHPHAYEHMYEMCRNGNRSLSDLNQQEKNEAAIQLLIDSDDDCDFPDDLHQQLSSLLKFHQLEAFKDKFLPEFFAVNKTAIDDIFEEALEEYKFDNPGTIKSDIDDWRALDNSERYRNIA